MLPLFLGFSIYLLPFLDRYLALAMAMLSAAYGLHQIVVPVAQRLQLVDSFGITLMVDSLSGYFVLTNALVTLAVVFYCWPRATSAATSSASLKKNKTAFFFAMLAILHGCVNAVFVCADFISLYVALEVIGVAAFLLVVYPRSDRTIWLGLRYLFVSNTAMLFYLMGAVLVYQANQSFAFVGLESAPTEAIALIFLGLLTKGGVFVSGLWLPATHAEAEAPVSALLSGIVSKTGVFPLVRCVLLVEELEPIVQIFSVGTALLGVGGAIWEKDTKRMLAFSSISQMGFILAAPVVAGFYALTHGLAKATLFLASGNLPARSFYRLRQTPIQVSLWCVVAAASLSISGFPLLAGFDSKVLTLKQTEGWQAIGLNIAAIGTAIVFAKFIFLPFGQPFGQSSGQSSVQQPVAPVGAIAKEKNDSQLSPGFWLAVTLLLSGLIAASALHSKDYTAINLIKSLSKIGAGWLLYFIFFRRLFNADSIQLPWAFERLEHLIGGMSLVLILLFWMVRI